MRKILVSGFLILTFMLILPLAVMEKSADSSLSAVGSAKPQEAELLQADTFRLYDKAADRVTEISAEEYILGVVAAEMPALYDEEALKAQAVAAYTFALYRKNENCDKDYDISTDHTADQSYIDRSAFPEKWGEKAAEYTEKLENAVRAVKGLKITYKDEPILAVYHAISSEQTETAENAWGKKLPYLISAFTPYDRLSPNYISTYEASAEELKSALSGKCKLEGSEADYFKDFERTECGNVKTVNVCGSTLRGEDIRQALSLRSANFKVSFKDGKFTFTVYGYGHGVGMSQYGADYMAKQGNDFKAILKYYYKGCEVE